MGCTALGFPCILREGFRPGSVGSPTTENGPALDLPWTLGLESRLLIICKLRKSSLSIQKFQQILHRGVWGRRKKRQGDTLPLELEGEAAVLRAVGALSV